MEFPRGIVHRSALPAEDIRLTEMLNHEQFQPGSRPLAPRWMAGVLVAAGLYNLLWGAAAVAFPLTMFDWAGMARPNYPQLWQCIGMIVGVYGLGYLAAARDPYRHWPITLVGLLGKVLGPIGFADAAMRGDFPWRAGWTILTNDLIWWAPFTMILLGARRAARDARSTT